MFNELVNNPFTTVNVIGYGTKWSGFFGKLRAMKKVFRKLHPETLVVLVDGFDTKIAMDVKIAEERYRNIFPHSPILFSRDCGIDIPIIGKWLHRRMFGSNAVANAGMYMGPAGKIVQLMREAEKIEKTCMGDDQRAFNMLSEWFDVDMDGLIFRNLSFKERKHDNEQTAVFIGYPGEVSFPRAIRAVTEYSKFLWIDIVGIVIAFLTVKTLMYRKAR